MSGSRIAAGLPQAMDSSASNTALVFARLDPILKRLLEGLTSLKSLLPSLSTKNVNDKIEATWVRLAKSLANDLELLAKGLANNPPERLLHAKALCVLQKYIALPLNAIFRLPLKEIYDNSTANNENQQIFAIRRSYVFRIYRLAAVAMQTFVEKTTIDDKNLLPTAIWIEHLVALIHAMPTYSEISSSKAIPNSLDDGTDAYCAMLATATTLIKSFHDSEEQLLTAWHGTLSMRLVDCLTAFLVCRMFSPRVQITALETLYNMLEVALSNPSQEFWRSVFPGVFTALYQMIANDASSRSKSSSSNATHATVQIRKLCLKSLIMLLQRTLSTENDSAFPESNPNSNDDLLAKLTSMVVTANNNSGNKHQKDETKTETTNEKETNSENSFSNQIRKRVEGPLIFLLRHLSLSSEDTIRRDVVELCQVILFETRHCRSTIDSLENPMKQIPLELCIGFQQDPDALVRDSSIRIIENYIQNDTDSPSTWMVTRIIELVQKLSALVHRGKSKEENRIFSNTTTSTEIRADLNLLAGYLQCLGKPLFGSNDTTLKESRGISTSIRNSIVSSQQLRRGLIQLCSVDLDSLSGKNESLISLVMDHRSPSPIKLRHLDHPELVHLAKDSILQSLGRLLGPKHGAIFVDEIISDFLEASFQISSNALVTSWLHEWLGSLIVAREVLIGSFSTESTDKNVSSEKKEKRRRKILMSLASSILPLLVDCSLWNLPLENQIITSKDIANLRSNTILSPQTLQRNQIIMILLMEVIGAFCQLLGGGLKDVLVTVFYPVVEKTTRRSPKSGSDIFQQMGLSTLHIMSLSCGLQSTEDLIHAEQNRLIAAMIGRLRLPGGSRIPKTRDDAEEILSVAKTSIWVLEMINRGMEMKNSYIPIGEKSQFTKNPAVMELLALLNYRLDHLFLEKHLVDADVEFVCSLHKAFFNYFLYVFQVKREATYSYQMKHIEKDGKQPWLDLLSQFLKTQANTRHSDEEGKENEGNSLDFTKGDIALFEQLIARDCYLLSHQKLECRISSCDALSLAFKFLAFVGSEHDDPNDDTNVIRNTILRQVADSWPSIRARLKSLSEVILHSYSGRGSSIVLVLNQTRTTEQRGKTEDIGTQRIFLSKVFQLIATMCECSGDFFADRFRNDVWPVMASHLEYLLKELQRQREAQTTTNPVASERKLITTTDSLVSTETFAFKMSDTQAQLIASILQCLNRILEQEECGKAVEKLLGSIGSTLLPLLDIEGQTKIQELSTYCIKSTLRIDSDVLRRPLMELSGTKIPPCPLKFRCAFHNGRVKAAEPVLFDFSVSLSTRNRSTIGSRCNELLDFADSLPEQAIS